LNIYSIITLMTISHSNLKSLMFEYQVFVTQGSQI